MGHRERSKLWPGDHQCNLLIVRREPWGTGLIASLELSVNLVRRLQTTQEEKVKYDGISLRAELWNCPTPSELVVQRISLDSYSAKSWVVFCVRGIRLLPPRELPNNLLFFYSQLISKGVTPIILIQLRTLHCPPQTSMSPYNLWKLLFSHFHTDNPYR